MTCYAGDGEREMNMFGLTKREQRWKAEQKAAELLVDLARTVIRARTEVEIAEAHTGYYKGWVKVVGVDMDCFAAHPETLEPRSCQGGYDPWAWSDPDPEPVETIGISEWQARRNQLRRHNAISIADRCRISWQLEPQTQ